MAKSTRRQKGKGTKRVPDTKFNDLPTRELVRNGVKHVDVDKKGVRYYRASFRHLFITKDRTLALDNDGNVYELVEGSYGGRIWMRMTNRVKDAIGIRPKEIEDDEDDE